MTAPAGKARRLYETLRRRVLHPAARLPGIEAVRHRATGARDRDVLDVVDALRRAGVDFWLAGGWGVDALVGRETRRHRDVDLIVDGGSRFADALAALVGLGYRSVQVVECPTSDLMPVGLVLRNRMRRTVDLHPADLSPPAGPGAARLEPAVGVVAGRRVPCLSAATQVDCHQGYETRGVDGHDVALLLNLSGRAGVR